MPTTRIHYSSTRIPIPGVADPAPHPLVYLDDPIHSPAPLAVWLALNIDVPNVLLLLPHYSMLGTQIPLLTRHHPDASQAKHALGLTRYMAIER